MDAREYQKVADGAQKKCEGESLDAQRHGGIDERGPAQGWEAPGGPAPGAQFYCSWNVTVTVMITGTGIPFCRVGTYSHCFTASSAA